MCLFNGLFGCGRWGCGYDRFGCRGYGFGSPGYGSWGGWGGPGYGGWGNYGVPYGRYGWDDGGCGRCGCGNGLDGLLLLGLLGGLGCGRCRW